MNVSRVYRILLLLYPAEFRNQFGREMVSVFRDAWEASAARSRHSRASFLIRELGSVTLGSLSEWIHNARGGQPFLAGALAAYSIHMALYAFLVPATGNTPRFPARIVGGAPDSGCHPHRRASEEDTLMPAAIATIIFLLSLASPMQAQQSDAETSIRDLYQQVISGIKLAKTDEDIRRLVEIMDVREWLSLDPTGLPMSREQARVELKVLLTVPPEHRAPRMEILWIGTTAGSSAVVLWVYSPMEITDHEGRYGPRGEKRNVLMGALVRDTFARTDLGWRRVRHEKIFPNQILTVDGRSLIAPPLMPPNPL